MRPLLSTDRIHLLLALLSALSGTWWGIGTALLVLLVLAARREARRALAGATGRGRSPAIGAAVGMGARPDGYRRA